MVAENPTHETVRVEMMEPARLYAAADIHIRKAVAMVFLAAEAAETPVARTQAVDILAHLTDAGEMTRKLSAGE